MRMSLLLYFSISILFFSISILSLSDLSYAISCDDNTINSSHTKEEWDRIITECSNKISEAKNTGTTLQSQINHMNNQINLTTAKIQNTHESIKLTVNEIDDLSDKITKLNKSLNFLSEILLNKIVENYKQRDVSVFEIFLTSDDASSLLKNIKYIQTAQNNDHIAAVKVERAKIIYEEKKILREDKKKELEQLEKTLNQQKSSLEVKKKQKQTLLTQTSNDEKKYKQLLAQSLAEYQAIQNALSSGSRIGPVKKGDPIALVGNSGYPGCSTGAHLHFEVRKDNSWVNPHDYLGSQFDWPISQPIETTQEYGHTPYSWRYTYSGGTHTGIDMISKSSDVIRAAADGDLFTSSQSCGSSSIINIKYIEHGNGLVSFYLHVK